MANPFEGKIMRLNDNCLFFKVERENLPPKGFLIRIEPPPMRRWSTESESALMLLDLLVVDEREKGISYDDLKEHLKRQYQLVDTNDYQDEKNVNLILRRFLQRLHTNHVLTEIPLTGQYQNIDDDMYPDLGFAKNKAEEAPPVVQGASSLFCCGYIVSRYRP